MRPIPKASTFERIREAYFAAKSGSEDPHDETVRTALQKSASGALVPLEIRQSNFGRGLFVKEFVPANTPVYDATRYGIFRTESQWKKFLDSIPSELQPDIIVWSYVLDWDTDLQVAAVDLDEGSLLNHGSLDDDPGTSSSSHGLNELSQASGRANIRYCSNTNQYLATRDLSASEELLCDYSSFHNYDHSLGWYDQTWNDIVGEHTEDVD